MSERVGTSGRRGDRPGRSHLRGRPVAVIAALQSLGGKLVGTYSKIEAVLPSN